MYHPLATKRRRSVAHVEPEPEALRLALDLAMATLRIHVFTDAYQPIRSFESQVAWLREQLVHLGSASKTIRDVTNIVDLEAHHRTWGNPAWLKGELKRLSRQAATSTSAVRVRPRTCLP